MKKLKEDIRIFLMKDDFEYEKSGLSKYPDMKAMNVLFKFLYSTDKQVKDNAIKAIGSIAESLANEDLEAVRNIIRRLMLNVTEESGGIGWGSPAAMGEIMAHSKPMAEEFHHILISYADPGSDNFLDNKDLQKDVLNGLKRLALSYPQYVKDVKHLLL